MFEAVNLFAIPAWGQCMNRVDKPVRVALWVYEGNHPDGKSHARYGDLPLALAAFAYWRAHSGDTELVQSLKPSQLGLKRERSGFGQTYAFRVTNRAALLDWYSGQ